MKRLISALLVLVFVLSLIGTSAMAAGGFDKSVFENSRKFSRFGFGNWSLIGGYEKSFVEADIKVRAFSLITTSKKAGGRNSGLSSMIPNITAMMK